MFVNTTFSSLLLDYYYGNVRVCCFIAIYIHYAHGLATLVFALCVLTVKVILYKNRYRCKTRNMPHVVLEIAVKKTLKVPDKQWSDLDSTALHAVLLLTVQW